ncbi:alpha/beta hydrolase [Cohnella fermenti]|uniref:Alpha/beta hydrolase n=1 Tax=Cohnella fermenti TaxID=2565925 RepID=A0A4S4C913_9BACL|nr:alpha/beta hydrolase [Cohnella fermenti]THF84180.1 alpha/beta hydrolase [Cohnella fermenti]
MEFRGRVNPELLEGLSLLPALRLPDDLAKVRSFEPLPRERSPLVRQSRVRMTGAGGQEMLLKIYEPEQRPEAELPALLWIHGGGYILGHPDMEDAICEQFVLEAGCAVFSPDYRLAPDSPYPAAIEDCYAALLWLESAAAERRIDRSRIAIGGASAGGGLTAALALLARDRGAPPIMFQMPLYPMLDKRNVTPSSHEIVDPSVWNRENNQAAWRMYLGTEDSDSPYASPSLASSLEGLPPAYLCVGQLDAFRDETIDYAARLAQAGVDVEFHLYPGGYHAFENFIREAEISKRARGDYVRALAEAFARSRRKQE